jgi:hypothetical protein
MRGFFPLCHCFFSFWHYGIAGQYMTTAIGGGFLSLNKTIVLSPSRHGAIKTVKIAPANDVNTEITSDVHSLRFGTRATNKDKDKIFDIAEKIENKIKDASISVEKVPFIITENIRFHGLYNIIDDYFIDSNSDSFGRFYIKEVGFYNAITDTFNITNYFFDFERKEELKTVSSIKKFLENCSPEFSRYIESTIKPAIKTSNPLMLMKSFEFITDADYTKYAEVTYIKSRIGPVKKVFIELSKNDILSDYDKLIYFSYNDEIAGDGENPYNDILIPYVTICDFKDYDMQFIIKRNLFSEKTPLNVRHITTIASYKDVSSPYSNIYLIGTSDGVFYKMYLDGSYTPVIDEICHNPFLHNLGVKEDSVIDNEALVDIRVDGDYIYFIGESKIALYNISLGKYIPIDPERYKAALDGRKLKYVKPLNEETFVFATDGGVITYDTVSRIFTNNTLNNKYYIDFKNNHASDYNNINYNFPIDNITHSSAIQVGRYEYIIGARTLDSSVCYKLNILTGEATDITSDSYHYVKPAICSNGKAIFSLGGKSNKEISSTRFDNEYTPYRAYNILDGKWTNEDPLHLEITDPLGLGEYGWLDNGLPIIAKNDNIIYLFHPYIVAIQGNINVKYYNNRGIKITLNDDYSINSLENFDITTPQEEESAALLPLELQTTWLPIRWDKTECEFISLYKVEEETTYYRLVQFKIDYETFSLNILKSTDITDERFLDYTEDILPSDALTDAKMFEDDGKALIFCRDKFILYFDEEKEVTIYSLEDESFLSPSLYNLYWSRANGNKTNLNTYLIHRDEYLVFSGGEGYRSSDYFDLNTFSLIDTPHYSTIENDILSATNELLEIPSGSLTVGSLSSCILNNTIYLAASVVTNSLALNNYEDLFNPENEKPKLLLLL